MESNNVMYYIDNLPTTYESIDKAEAHFVSEMEDKHPLDIRIIIKGMSEFITCLK